MKIKKTSAILIMGCLIIAVFTIYWSFIVVIDIPTGGLGWTYKRDLDFVKQNFTICLVSPDKNITSDDLDYMNWGIKEFQARILTGIIILSIFIISVTIINLNNRTRF